MCDWMNDPAFIGYAFECEQREKEEELKRQERQKSWLDRMNEDDEEEDNG